MTRLVLRIWLPDRPGALGAVASRVGAVKADVVGIDVIERDGGVAIDELVVDLPDDSLIDLMLSEIRQVDGAAVEEVHRDPSASTDPAAASLRAALQLARAPDTKTLAEALVQAATGLVSGEWAGLLDRATSELLAEWGECPEPSWLAAYRDGLSGGSRPDDAPASLDPLCLPIPGSDTNLFLGRQSRPVRGRERERLQGLAELAGARWAQLDHDGVNPAWPGEPAR